MCDPSKSHLLAKPQFPFCMMRVSGEPQSFLALMSSGSRTAVRDENMMGQKALGKALVGLSGGPCQHVGSVSTDDPLESVPIGPFPPPKLVCRSGPPCLKSQGHVEAQLGGFLLV